MKSCGGLGDPVMLGIAALAVHIALRRPYLTWTLLSCELPWAVTKEEQYRDFYIPCSIAFAAAVRAFSLILYCKPESRLPSNGA